VCSARIGATAASRVGSNGAGAASFFGFLAGAAPLACSFSTARQLLVEALAAVADPPAGGLPHQLGQLGVAGVELVAHQLQHLLAELGVAELIEQRVDRRGGRALDQELRDRAAGRDRSVAQLLAQRALGHGALRRQHLRGALGQRLVVALEDRDQVAGDAGRAVIDQRLERQPAHDGVGVGEAADQPLLDRLVVLAHRRQHGGRRGAQIHPIVLEERDHGSPQVLGHGVRLTPQPAGMQAEVGLPGDRRIRLVARGENSAAQRIL
jgi:hypothetical protein